MCMIIIAHKSTLEKQISLSTTSGKLSNLPLVLLAVAFPLGVAELH